MKQRRFTSTRLFLEELESRLAMSSPGANLNPGILPIQSDAYGATYNEWAARWWQWAYKQPVNTNPLFDQTGAMVANGQSGHVWFLAGVINVSGTATRSATIPTGKALFFPILNVENDNFGPPNNPPLSVADLRAGAKAFMDSAINLEADIDGRVVQNPAGYREQSPVFSVNFPDNNVFQFFGFNTPAGTYSPFVDDGYYLMLAPLSAGPHTIHFHGTVSVANFTVDITYHLNVVGGQGAADPTLATALTNTANTPTTQPLVTGTGQTTTGQTTTTPAANTTGNTPVAPPGAGGGSGTTASDQIFADGLHIPLFHVL
jgi:hypothetical protein